MTICNLRIEGRTATTSSIQFGHAGMHEGRTGQVKQSFSDNTIAYDPIQRDSLGAGDAALLDALIRRLIAMGPPALEAAAASTLPC